MNPNESTSAFTGTLPLYHSLRTLAAVCKADVQATDLTNGIIFKPTEGMKPDESFALAQIRFALDLFRETASVSGYNNLLLSPLSVMLALSMTANGADADTLTEMERVLGLSVLELNRYFASYLSDPSMDENCRLYLANSLWIKDGYEVKQDFLQTNADCYGASVYSSPFDDQTVTDVNNWVKAKTDGMIENMLGSVSPGAVMYIINALSFDAKWANAYTSDDVEDGVFTASNGTKCKVKFMRETGYDSYLEDRRSTGFIKRYEEGYAFAAILPKKGITLEKYLDKLTVKGLYDMIREPKSYKTVTAVPKFSYSYDAALRDVLKQLGMPSAFNAETANFTRIGAPELYISDVLHKTFIEVNEDGTRAGASTVVPIMLLSAPPGKKEKEIIKYVTLDRPFLFLIIDCKNNIPIFMGTVTDIN